MKRALGIQERERESELIFLLVRRIEDFKRQLWFLERERCEQTGFGERIMRLERENARVKSPVVVA